MTKMEQRVTQVVVLPVNDSLFSERSTTVSIVDEGGGEFVTVEQDDATLRIDPEEWPMILEAVTSMVNKCRDLTP